MKKTIPSIILFLILSCESYAQNKTYWMIGPMLHINIGGEKIRPSWGFELSYWDYNGWPYSFDGAIEFERHKVRLYTEVQTGIAAAGLSAGPLIELRTDERAIKLGYQGSIWGNYFWGFDLRFRSTGGNFYFCPGTYLKIPVGPNGLGSGSDHHHSSDWDD